MMTRTTKELRKGTIGPRTKRSQEVCGFAPAPRPHGAGLIDQPKPDLHRPGVARYARDLAGPRVLDVDESIRRQVEVDVVEDVVGIEPQLQAPLRPQPEIPLHAEIHVPETGPAHDVPPRVAEAVDGNRERGHVEPPLHRR